MTLTQRMTLEAFLKLPEDKPALEFTDVEIMSPAQSVREQAEKCRWYVANGVRIALLVDSERERVTVFRPDAEPRTLRGTDRIDLDDILPGFQLSIDELFAALD